MDPITIGGIVGFLGRLAPEFMKWWDRKNERAHELAMQDKAIAMQKLKGDQTIDEVKIKGNDTFDLAAINALTEAIKGQDAPLPMSGHKVADFFIALANVLSKLMRPAITIQWVLILYPAVVVCGIIAAFQTNGDILDAMLKAFGSGEKAIAAGIINFWFLDRVIRATSR